MLQPGCFLDLCDSAEPRSYLPLAPITFEKGIELRGVGHRPASCGVGLVEASDKNGGIRRHHAVWNLLRAGVVEIIHRRHSGCVTQAREAEVEKQQPVVEVDMDVVAGCEPVAKLLAGGMEAIHGAAGVWVKQVDSHAELAQLIVDLGVLRDRETVLKGTKQKGKLSC